MHTTIQHLLARAAALLTAASLTACNQFLEVKSDKSFVVPDKLAHLQAILDHHTIMNQGLSAAGESSSTDYYVAPATYQGMRADYRNQYTWQPGYTFPNRAEAANDWEPLYQVINRCNTVLDALPSIPRDATNALDWDYVKGQALLLRSIRFLNIASIWALAYDPLTADAELGIPLRLTADFTEPSTRASLAETYGQLLADLHASAALMPDASLNSYRGSKPAAHAALARTYLSMRHYPEARIYADSCLRLRSELMDFNDLSIASNTPIGDLNPENILHLTYRNYPHLMPGTIRIAPDLLALYAAGDLRKDIFYREVAPDEYTLKAHYSGNTSLFAGLSVNEALLIRAECAARAGDIAEALDDLNRLRLHRFRAEDFEPVVAKGRDAVVEAILAERRRELPFRGIRWIDIKRLNMEGADITLTREIDGQEYALPSNDLRYALLIPEDVIERSGMPQNPR